MRSALSLLVALLATHRPALADIVVYADDRDGWESAVGTFHTADFVGLGFGPMDPDAYAHLGVTFFEPQGSHHFYRQESFEVFQNDGAGLYGEGPLELRFDAPIFGVALDFNGTYRAEIYQDGEFLGYMTGWGGGLGNFAGFISTSPFDRVVLYDPIDDFLSIDDIHFGPPIPAPAPFVILLIAGVHRRRRR